MQFVLRMDKYFHENFNNCNCSTPPKRYNYKSYFAVKKFVDKESRKRSTLNNDKYDPNHLQEVRNVHVLDRESVKCTK